MLDSLTIKTVDSTASRQWATRPDDERYTSIADLKAAIQKRTDPARDRVAPLASMRSGVDAAGGLVIDAELAGELWTPTNYSFGQLATAAGAPAGYLRTLPAGLASECLNNGLHSAGDSVQLYHTARELRGVTGPNYGRIRDIDVVSEIKRVTSESGIDWRVPTAFRNAANMSAYESVDPTKESTTLYASDRDVFLFLVDEEHPIEAGFTRDGKPDLFFRGFYAWNGECGGVSGGFKAFLYRYVCSNRNIWGQAELGEFKLKHTKHAGLRFESAMVPALTGFANSGAGNVERQLLALKSTPIASTDEERAAFLFRLGFGPADSAAILARGLAEEQAPAESVFDMVQAITAHARTIQHTDTRIGVEAVAGKLMAKAMAMA